MAQIVISLVLAALAVSEGIPDVAIGPPTRWQRVFMGPWSLAYKLSGTVNLLPVVLTLFLVYAVTGFLILRYLVIRPAFRKPSILRHGRN